MKPPAFQWYPKDCDTDEKVRLMDDREYGFYGRCLNHSWTNDGLPGDLVDIARAIGRSLQYVNKVWPRVGGCFPLCPDGRRRNPKQELQRKSDQEFREGKSKAGSKGAKTRWQKDDTANGSATDLPIANDSSAPASASAIPPVVPPTEKYDPVIGWEWFQQEYPSGHINPVTDCRLWLSIVNTRAIEEKIRAKLPAFKRSLNWQDKNGKFIPGAKRFLSELMFEQEPGLSAPESTPDPYRRAGGAE